jgi:hypothetical protein
MICNLPQKVQSRDGMLSPALLAYNRAGLRVPCQRLPELDQLAIMEIIDSVGIKMGNSIKVLHRLQ